MDTLTFIALLGCIASIPLTTYLALRIVLTHLATVQMVGGLPKELRMKELEIAAVQTEINKLKEETRLGILRDAPRPAPMNIHS